MCLFLCEWMLCAILDLNRITFNDICRELIVDDIQVPSHSMLSTLYQLFCAHLTMKILSFVLLVQSLHDFIAQL